MEVVTGSSGVLAIGPLLEVLRMCRCDEYAQVSWPGVAQSNRQASVKNPATFTADPAKVFLDNAIAHSVQWEDVCFRWV